MDLRTETIALPLSAVAFTSIDDQTATHSTIKPAVENSLRYIGRLPQGAITLRVGIGWPMQVLPRADFGDWFDQNRTSITWGLEPAEMLSKIPVSFGRRLPLTGAWFIGKQTQSVDGNSAYADFLYGQSVQHSLKSGGYASGCLGDSALDTVQKHGVDCTVLKDATADFYVNNDGKGAPLCIFGGSRRYTNIEAGFQEGFEARMLQGGVGLAQLESLDVSRGMVRFTRTVCPEARNAFVRKN